MSDHENGVTGCGLIVLYGPPWWRRWLHVWIGDGDTCCCGQAKREGK